MLLLVLLLGLLAGVLADVALIDAGATTGVAGGVSGTSAVLAGEVATAEHDADQLLRLVAHTLVGGIAADGIGRAGVVCGGRGGPGGVSEGEGNTEGRRWCVE